MSKWLGFIVGLAIAITIVLTVVRPTVPDDTGKETAEDTGQALELPTPPVPDTSAETRLTSQESDLPDEPAAAEHKSAADTLNVEEIAASLEDTAGDTAEAIAEPIAEPIPEFRWDTDPVAASGTEVIPAPEPQVTFGDDPSPDQLVAVKTPPAPVTTPLPDEITTPEVSAAYPTQAAGEALDKTAPPDSDPARQWYAFWQPFGSELSAKGFSNRLERITGLDYRVVKVEAGEYHVAFGYDDEQSRIANLSTIEAATGLRLSGQSL